MHIAMVASECEPFAKTGGLADVVDALSRALGQLGHEVDVYLPMYRGIEIPDGAEHLELEVPMGTGIVHVALHSAKVRGYQLRLVDHGYSFDRPDYYVVEPGVGPDYPDNGWRFTLLGRAALEAMRVENRVVDVLHGHDWEAAPAILGLVHRYRSLPEFSKVATVLTCHNLAYHGWVPGTVAAAQLDLPDFIVNRDAVDLLREGLIAADLATTVSPTFARESLEGWTGEGVADVLREGAANGRYLGIINGLDNDLWDPATDTDLPATFSATDLLGKRACRAHLCAELGLDADGPVLAMVSRLDGQKGFDLLAAAAPDIIDMGARICILGTGDKRLVGQLQWLAGESEGRLAVVDRFDRALARRMYAGADSFLMPSLFEPCGQSQMIAMRYGTPPIVRFTGGLVDTVTDADYNPESGNGFGFGPADPGALIDAVRRAMAAHADPERWSAIVQRAMATDFSWRGPATEYVAAYGGLTE
ncbi:MAG TPA: glycogen/starch synthase [Candidatus Limnocylindria bacterium]|nr:glycogen/starch synthase [Candidatus Limnocylindria bacterium]